MKNPFEILGLNPYLLKKIKDKNIIENLVQKQYRSLQQLFHPDHYKGSSKFSQEFSKAKSDLENPEVFHYFLNKFVQSTSKNSEIAELKDDVENLESNLYQTQQKTIQLLINAAKEEGNFSLCKGLELIMVDIVRASRVNNLILSDGNIVKETQAKQDQSIYKLWFEDKVMNKEYKKIGLNTHNRYLLCTIPRNTLQNSQYKGISCLFPQNTQNLSLDTKEDVFNTKKVFDYEISKDNLAKIIEFSTMSLEPNSYLFSVIPRTNQIYLEGIIHKTENK